MSRPSISSLNTSRRRTSAAAVGSCSTRTSRRLRASTTTMRPGGTATSTRSRLCRVRHQATTGMQGVEEWEADEDAAEDEEEDAAAAAANARTVGTEHGKTSATLTMGPRMRRDREEEEEEEADALLGGGGARRGADLANADE